MNLGKRRNVVTVVGETEAGKTTLILELIKDYDPERGMVTILDTQGESKLKQFAEINMNQITMQKSGIYRVMSQNWKTFVDESRKNFMPGSEKKGLVFIDDADLIEQNEYKPLTDLLGGVRHKKVDFISSYHNLWRVPPYIMDNTQILILFKTGEAIEKGNIKRFKKGARIMEAQIEVEENPNKHFYKIIPLHGF